jgi:integrase
VTTYRLARFVDWLADENEQGKRLGDATIANIVIPLRAALATAKREGVIRHNPAQGLSLPHRDQVTDPEQGIKVFSREQLAAVLAMAPTRHRLLLELLATTGLRISEAIALQRLHLQLDGPKPEVCVRRAIVRERIEPPKTKYGRRDVLLPASLVSRLRVHLAEQTDQDSIALVFPNEAGGVVDPSNLRRRVPKPLVEEVNAPWAGFHTFRHTFASIHLSQGTNLLQLSRVLGHHSAAFTLTRYTHLLPGEEAPALNLAPQGARGEARRPLLCVSADRSVRQHRKAGLGDGFRSFRNELAASICRIPRRRRGRAGRGSRDHRRAQYPLAAPWMADCCARLGGAGSDGRPRTGRHQS